MDKLLAIFVFCLALFVNGGHASFANITPNNRSYCPETPSNRPPNRVNTGHLIRQMQALMRNASLTTRGGYQAYIITAGDGHGGKGSDHYRRVAYLTGFTGSGYAVVTSNRAAVWTDGRYFEQADQQLDCNWTLMKTGVAGYPGWVAPWLRDVLPRGSKVGVFSKFSSIGLWTALSASFASYGFEMHSPNRDLIDIMWTNRPAPPSEPKVVHPIAFAGKRWQQKLTDVRQKMTSAGTDVFVTGDLAEIAWLLNMRGRTSQFSPLFYGYVIVNNKDSSVRLFIRHHRRLLNKPALRTHLNTNQQGTCAGMSGACVQVKDYETFFTELRRIVGSRTVQTVWLDLRSSQRIYDVTGNKTKLQMSMIQMMKAVKNPTEVKRYQECQVRDSAALSEWAAFMEKEMAAGRRWTEKSSANRLSDIRRSYQYSRDISFPVISASGKHAAIIHYRPSNSTDRVLSKNEVHLVDSGGNYLDGTTDVTRTFHYGTPTDEEKTAYTLVLIGVIELADTVWPDGYRGADIDARTRTPLWQRGMDYRHGTGHGIGYYLTVHEGPASISVRSYGSAAIKEHMFFSDEPGYYKTGSFGIRLESIIRVVEAKDANGRSFPRRYLAFDPTTYVPFEPKLIKKEMLEKSHRKWLNMYNKRCREKTGEYLRQRGKTDGYNWVVSKTHPYDENPKYNDKGLGISLKSSFGLVVMLSAMLRLSS